MKIGFVYDAVYPWSKGGLEKSIYELGRELTKRGHDVHLFGMHCWPGERDIVRDGLSYHGVCSALSLYNSKGRRRLVQPLRFGCGVLASFVKYDLRTFDVMDVQAFPYFSVLAFWMGRVFCAPRLRWVVTWAEVWGTEYWIRYLGRLGHVGVIMERLCARFAPQHICISARTSHRLQDYLHVPAKQIDIVPRGVDLPEDVFSGNSSHRFLNSAVTAGRLVDHKRVDLLLRAWQVVVECIPDAKLVVIGDGPGRSRLELLREELGIVSNVEFRGMIADWKEVLREIASARLFLQASEREGQSLVVLEAMALKVPVVVAAGPETAASDLLGQSEHKSVAIIPVEKGPEEWAARIQLLFQDDALATTLGREGCNESQKFSLSRVLAARMEAVYSALITEDSPKAGVRSHGRS